MLALRILVATSLIFSVASRAAAASDIRLGHDAIPRAYNLSLDARTGSDGFSGEEEIRVDLRKPLDKIWLHAKEITVDKAELIQGGQRIPAMLGRSDADGRAPFVPLHPAAAEPATLAIWFHAKYGTQNEGFYKVHEAGLDYLVTQFEATAAREAFPCFDEPGFKAPLTLQLTVNDGDVAAANAPIAREEKIAGGKRVTFEPTAPLPTYLYAWTVGPFEVVQAPPIPPNAVRPNPLPLRGLAAKGHGTQLAAALAEAAKLVPAEEAYFGIAYPWKKLDLEAVPDFEAGAMENAGLITFRSDVLLLDPVSASLVRRKHLSVDLAHELAHQWFGDLVTLAWWDDVWLNEAFASWMETRTVDEVHPEFRVALAAAEDADHAMDADSLASSRKIRQPIHTTADIHDAFDEITYSKGEAVIRMFEQYVGDKVFQAAIHAYLAAHANSTATSDDLLASLSKQTGRDIATPFRTFLDQPGVPLVKVEFSCSEARARAHMVQSRYLPLGSKATRDQLWQVPVCARYFDSAAHTDAIACTLLTHRSGELRLPGGCPTWLQPNSDLAGYYRWTLPAAQLQQLSRANLSALDRFAVAAAVRAGYDASAIPARDALSALEPFSSDAMPEVAGAFGQLATDALQNLADDSWRAAVRTRMAHAYASQLAQLGLQDRRGDGDATVELRAELVELLAEQADDSKLRMQLAALGRAYLAGAQVHPEAVAPEIAPHAVAAALSADATLVAPTIARFFRETDDTARSNLLNGLSLLRQPESAAQVRALAMDPRTRVNETMHPYFVQASDFRTRPAEWAEFQRNYDALAARVGQEAHGYLPDLAGDPCTEAGAAEVEAFFAAKAKSDPDVVRSAAQQVESIRLCAARAQAQRASARAFFTAR